MKRKALFIFLLSLTVIATGCSQTGTSDNTTTSETTDNTASDTGHATQSTVTLTEGKYSDEKLDDSWSKDTAGTLTLNKDSITSDDKTVQIDKTTATITKAGTYILTGTLTDGQIIVDAENKGDVKLVLNDADINCSSSAPIYIKSGNTVITLADGTENSVSDGEEYIYEKEDDDEPNAAIFAKDDLTFNGSGSLIVTGNYNHAIQSKDDLKFVAGTFDITSVGDGIVGKDSISVKDGIFTITSAGDGIKSTNIEETDKGYIMIDGGTFQIQSENDAMQAETLLRVNDGTFDILTNGTGQNMTQNSDSAKALKSYVELTVAGGKFTINSCDDVLHSNQNVTIENGTFTITSSDDGIHAEDTLTINNGSIDIVQSYEGLEGFDIVINDGEINVVSSDDGVNAAGGSDDGSNPTGGNDDPAGRDNGMTRPDGNMGDRGGDMGCSGSDIGGHGGGMDNRGGGMGDRGGGMAGEDQGASLTINGGTLYVNAEGDGLDANGDILISGGNITVHGPVNGGNGTLDYASECQITGGTFFAVGSIGMMQNPSESSIQLVITQTMKQPVPAGTSITLKNSSGTTIAEVTTEKNVQWYAISTPELKEGETNTICIGDEESSVTLNDTITQIQ